MNIDGIQIVPALFFVVLCGVVTWCYAILFYQLTLSVRLYFYKVRFRIARKRWNADLGADPAEFVKKPANPFINIPLFKKLGLLVLIFYLSIYANQRINWIKSDSKYLKAKEYWVAGQVIFTPRRLFEYAVHPDNFLVRPFTLLQRAVFNRGVRFLPQDDGERYVWENSWFLYLYTRKTHRPYGVTSEKYEPEMVELLDRCWKAMDGMMTLETADPYMKRKSFIDMPLLANYYSLLQGHYTGKFRGSGTVMTGDDELVERFEILLTWMDDLEKRWKNNALIKELRRSYPAVLMNREMVLLEVLQELSLAYAMRGKFACDHPITERLYQEYLISMSADPMRNPFLLYSKRNREQAAKAYLSSVYHAQGAAANYLLAHVCNKDMPEEQYAVVKRGEGFSFFDPPHQVEWVFDEELKLLIGDKDE